MLYPTELRARYRVRIIRVKRARSTPLSNFLFRMSNILPISSQLPKNRTKQTFACGCYQKYLRQCAQKFSLQTCKESHDCSKY
ncbi:Uncharacterised protein [Vibrio cholerae]|nr:Uncharacterised protein [Vibrio cholerae]CSI78777.1 Uncharacterised protein [Vibrio cholerae]